MTRFKNQQNPFVLFLILSFFMGILPQGPKASESKQPTRSIIDRAGRTVSIPQNPQKIACIFGPSYEKIFAFGGANRISIVSNVILPWNYPTESRAERIYPSWEILCHRMWRSCSGLKQTLLFIIPLQNRLSIWRRPDFPWWFPTTAGSGN